MIGEVGPVFDGPSHRGAQDTQIDSDHLFEIRMLHLDRHILTRPEHAAVHLCDGSGGQWLRIDLMKDLTDRLSQFLLNSPLDSLEGERRQPILKDFQFFDYLGVDEINPYTEALTEFDIGRSQLFNDFSD